MICLLRNFILFYTILTATSQKMEQCSSIMDRFEWQKNIIPKKNGENFYWKSTPPQVNESVPIEVQVAIIPTAIRKISLAEQTIEIQYILYVLWKDCRLNISYKNQELIMLASEIARELWVPAFEYRNCIGKQPIVFDERVHTIAVLPNETLGYYSRRVVSLHCSYDLSGYPMDSQRCKLQLQVGAPKSVIDMKVMESLEEELLQAQDKIVPPQYKLNTIILRECQEKFSPTIDFACLELYIVFDRQMTFHMGVTFLPSILIVILSWISFWMDADAAAPRVTLGLTSMLTLVTTYVNAQKDLPAVSYLKAIDVYMFACIFLVFASLIEFCIANYLSRIAKGTVPHKILSVASSTIRPEENDKSGAEPKPKIAYVSPIDKTCRLIFPIIFLIFNICYWSHFLH